MSNTKDAMNAALRIMAGRETATRQQPGLDRMTIARRYADVLGLTIEDALERVDAWERRVPSGAAGAGTQDPPARRASMNDVLRFMAGKE